MQEGEMLTKADWDYLKDTEDMIQAGRKCDPGDFYLLHRLGVEYEDPTTGEITYYERREYIEPTVRIMKGDEHVVVPAGILEQGDIICTFSMKDGLDLSDVWEVVFKEVIYYRKRLYQKGLGESYTRQQLFCSRAK